MTNQFLRVPVLGDVLGEPDATLFLVLSAPENAVIERGLATAVIKNDDNTPNLRITSWMLEEESCHPANRAIDPYERVPSMWHWRISARRKVRT